MKPWLVVSVIALMLLGIGIYLFRDTVVTFFMRPTESSIKTDSSTNPVSVVAKNLTTPWAVTFLPNGDMLVPEREGTLQRIGSDGKTFSINGVEETSEGGLLGVALAPDFSLTNRLFIYYTTVSSDSLSNQIDSYTLVDNSLTNRHEILKNIPAANNHNGGAIAFGPDEKLYATTGDAAQENLAQDTSSLAGKILRINADGSIPSDNPFNNAVWSYGHRNPQGIAWDSSGQLWSVEHGPSGAATGRDELNRIKKGANYGWPTISGSETSATMESPVLQSGDNETWAPAGLAYFNNTLYFAGLRGQSLYKVDISSPDSVSIKDMSRLFANEYGRLRAVTVHENQLYFSTSNRDGRGNPAQDDDRILRFKL